MMTTTESFRAAMLAVGITPPDTINGDGGTHRFSTGNKTGNRNGWYFLYEGANPWGQAGDWATGGGDALCTWSEKTTGRMTQAELDTMRAQQRAVKAQHDQERTEGHDAAAVTAKAIWDACTPVNADHGYLMTKQVVAGTARVIQATSARRLSNRLSPELAGPLLVIPMNNAAGQLRSLQFITETGTKRPLTGGEKQGCYFAIGKPTKGVIVVCEGWATGASIHEATGDAVAVAFDAGNLYAVALVLRTKYPALKIVLAADDDYMTDSNPGMTKARAAALAVSGWLAVPDFNPLDRGDKDSDFNDLAKREGLGAVKACFDGAIELIAGQAHQQDPAGLDDAGKKEDDFVDHHRNAPRPDPACLYGLIGDIARAGSDNTEANPFAVAAAALAFMSVAIGRGPFMTVGDDGHHTNLYFLHVGRSARGRKGTAKKLVLTRLAKAIKELNEYLAPQIHSGGLSSREGLALLIHDGFSEGKNEVPAIEDKRLLVVESEFANILHQSGRNGNTLSPALRDTWDGIGIKPATKTNRISASNPHIGMIADVTPIELLDLMQARELSNGFANRFIIFWAEGDKVNPFPKPTPQHLVDELAQRMAEVLRFAGADRHVERDHLRVELSREAVTLYARLYRGELRDRSAGERVAGLLDRRAPMMMRLAMLFAVTDLSSTVEAVHIQAAMAWVRYWVESVKFIFQSAMDEAGAAEAASTGDKIVAYLNEHGQASRSELTTDCFHKHVSKTLMDKALDELLSANPALIEVESVPRAGGKSGTPTKIYKARANCAKRANCGAGIGFAPEFDSLRTVRTVANCGIEGEEAPPLNQADSHTSPHFAHFASGVKPLETLTESHTSHTSHTSHAYSENENTGEATAGEAEVF